MTLEDVYTLDVACGSIHTLCITNEGTSTINILSLLKALCMDGEVV